uniref:F-box/kelch-repeat protein At3g06240-like n=1 Tax=Erigeron canadensis TaxID=72917 RepID=UPI001CB97C5B|nr:F-box/kelch-repeat protein At3g06240-like [Erigeron canadensis]
MSNNNDVKHNIFNLPQVIILHILSCLPIKSLLQFRRVSKSSRQLVSHPYLAKRHLLASTPNHPDDHHLLIYYETDDYKYEFYSLRSPITLQETLKLQTPDNALHGYLRIVGSSKGLMCFFDTNYFSNVGRVILWNPSVNKYKIVCDPVYNDLNSKKFSHFVVGFGLVSRDLEFKVVEIVYYSHKVKVVNDVFVYSFSTDTWKKKDNVTAPCFLARGWSSNVMVNGFVHWLGRKGPGKGDDYLIMAFDIENECFSVVELPKNMVYGYDQLYLVPYGDSICLSLCAHYIGLNGIDKWDIWVMGDYGVANSWMKVCVVMQPKVSNPPLMMKSYHRVLVVTNDGSLGLYDSVKKQMWNLGTSGLKESFRAVHYTASLALLN